MSLDIDKPSQLSFAIAQTLAASGLDLKVATLPEFDATFDHAWVLIDIAGNASGVRANDGRIAHVMTITLQAIPSPVLGNPRLAACDLTSVLKSAVTDNRWGLAGSQCDLPMNLDAVPSSLVSGAQEYLGWTLSFTQTIYLGAVLLDDPLGTPKFAKTWEVSNIDDPDQYSELEA